MIGSLTRFTKFSVLVLLLVGVISCASKATPSSPRSDEAIYFMGLNGFSFSLKSADKFRTAIMKDSSDRSYELFSSSKECMDGEVRVCFYEKFATVKFKSGVTLKAVAVPKVKR